MATSSLTVLILVHMCLFMMISTSIAQFVIDTNGEAVEVGDEYFIRPPLSGNGGRFTLVNKNGSCPLNVGLENPELPEGLSVVFIPFVGHHDDDHVRVNRDLRIQFIASSICGQSTDWKLGERDATSGRRLIVTGVDDRTIGSFGNFFRIVHTQTAGIYNIQWCPKEVCPSCDFICGTVGVISENGKFLLALDGGAAVPVVFQQD